MSARVFVAMSGGVDSSVAAHLLKKAGYAVTGIHLELSSKAKIAPDAEHADLEHTCRLLDIPLHYLDLEREFDNRIIAYFCAEYSRGRTPNPCIRCNKYIKFGLLLDKVREMGGDHLATGHYARVETASTGYRLLKGIDQSKDQSYFLYVLGQAELARVLFPLGGMYKSEVKQLAAGWGLPAASRPESQDICFIPGNDNRAFIATRLTLEPGEIVDVNGNVLGRHEGLAYYTIGQRQGIGVSSSERLYVTGLDIAKNRLIIGPPSQLFKHRLVASELNWISGEVPESNLEVSVKIRYRSQESRATLRIEGKKADVCFDKPQRALAPGQSVVFYQGDIVLGGGIIGETA
jgi:tRNA-specific 2-thiouridylase